MTFPINTTIPAANNDPADDQPLIQQNFVNISGYVQVDHTNPSNTGAGEHKYVTFNDKNTPSAPTDPKSALFTFSGTASTKAEVGFINEDGTFPVTLLKAYGFCNTSGVISSQSYNVSSVTHASTGVYNIVLTAGAVASANFGIVITSTRDATGIFPPLMANYSITGVGTFTINFLQGSTQIITGEPTNFTFLVYQL